MKGFESRARRSLCGELVESSEERSCSGPMWAMEMGGGSRRSALEGACRAIAYGKETCVTEAPRGQWFIPGDRISFVFSFRHEMNVEEVRAVFARRENPDARIELKGIPVLEEQYGVYKFSSVELANEVAPDAVPGEYRCEGLLVRSAGGRDVPFEEAPDLRFLVIEEPTGAPTVRGIPIIRGVNRWKKAP